MKNKIQIMFVRGLQKALNHDNGPRLPRHWKVIASTLLLLFTLGIGNVWGAYSYNHATSVPEWTVNFDSWNGADDAATTTAETVHNPRLYYDSSKSKWNSHSQANDIGFDADGFYYMYQPGAARQLPTGDALSALCYVVAKAQGSYFKYNNTSSTVSSPATTINGLTTNNSQTTDVAYEFHMPRAGYIRLLIGTDSNGDPTGTANDSWKNVTLSGATTGTVAVTYHASGATYDVKTKTGATTFSTTTYTSAGKKLRSVEFAVNSGTTTMTTNPAKLSNNSGTARKMFIYAIEVYMEEASGGGDPSCEATANAGADKNTTVGVGVAMAATAAGEGYTGAWSIKAGSPSTSTSQLSSTSAYNATFTPSTYGTYTLVWTVTDNNNGSCSASDEATVTVPAPTHGILYTNLKDMDNSANPTSYSEGTGVASFAKLRHAVGYDFTGWSPSSISSSATTDQTINAQWTANAVAAGTGTLTYALGYSDNTITTSSITRNNGALYDATDLTWPEGVTIDDSESAARSGKITTTNSYDSEKYLSLTFKIADGYSFTPTEVQLNAVAVSNDKTIRFEFKDNAETPNTKYLEQVRANGSSVGTLTYDFDASDPVTLTGTVTVKIYAYGATNSWRLGTPITITGTVASTAVPSGYAIETSTEHGTIAVTDGSSAISSADEDDVVYIAATPDTGYGFTSWDIYKTSDATTKVSLLADDDSDNKTRKFSMPAYPVTVGATFSAIDYTVTHNAASNGSYTIKVGDAEAVSTNTTANYGQTVTLAATPAGGYTFAGWIVLQGETPVTVTNNAFTMPAGNVTVSASFDEITCPTEGTVYSASTSATGDISIAAGATNLELNSATHKTSVSGGKMYVYNGQTSDKNLITSTGFSITNGNTYFHIQLDCALEAGDIISVKVGKNADARGVWISSTRTDNVPSSAPACALTATGTGSGLKAVTYTVTGSDEYHGKTDFYIYRATGNGTYFNDISITRPEKFDVTYYKNDGTETSTVATDVAVVAANEFTRSGYRFIEWNTQADGNGSKVNVGAAVIADIELFAIWAQEYSVSYANTGAASGDAPTNANKYITGETFKVAGVGSMVAAENYAFGGWDDGTAIYQENDDYTVGSANVSFTPVWNLHYTVTYKANGGTGDDIVVDNPAKIADCVFETPENKLFDKWNAKAEGDGANYAVGADVSSTLVLYAIWKDDECTTNRKSIFKAVLTGDAAATVTGENGKEYAGDALLNKLGGSNSNRNTDATIEGVGSGLTTYKMNGTGAYMYGTLKKGAFQEGDKIHFAVSSTPGTLAIYGAKSSDLSQRVHIADMPAPNAAKVFTYTLTAANATALAGYDAIGIYRADGVTMNPFLYSLEITGCRDWAVSHTVTFNKMGKGADIAPAVVAEGDKVTKPTVVEPEGWALAGWYKEEGLVNEWDFASDVMGEEDITLYAKWESEEGVIKLFSNTGVLNTTNFVSAAKKDGGIDIDEVNYPCLVDFGSNRSSLAGTTQADVVQYNASTNAAKIKLDLYNNASGAKTAYLWMVEEGATESGDPIEISIPGKTRLTTSYTSFNSEKPRSFYLTSGSKSDIKVLQVKVMDNGTAIPQFGKAGYSVNLNKGRVIAAANGTVPFDGATMHSNDAYTVLNSSNFKPKTYIQFNNAVANTTVKITKASSNKYYVTNDLEHKGDEYSTDQEIVLTTTGTWYIGSVSSGSVAAFSKIEFIAPKCEAPAFNALANSDICSGDAYVALDGTGTVSDGGSITYKWYAEGDAETVLATTATYMPEADGSYYVVALHHVDGYTDNEVTSDVVTVKTHAGTAISEPLADQRGNVDDVVALEVAASGKHLHYAWKECATIDGEYTAVAGAADAASLDVTITEGMDKYYKVIVSSDCGDAQESVAHVTQYVPVAQANVTGSIAWNWANAASVNEIQLTKTSTPKKNEGFVMANGAATIYNNANFESDKLYLEGEYIVREGKYFQGQTIKFNTTVAGAVRVKFSHTGNNKPARELYINGVGTGDSRTSATAEWSRYVEVPAGEVAITAYHVDPADGAGQQYIRVPEIEFLTIAHQRTSGYKAGDLGTVCLEDAAVINGATLYELGGLDGNGYLAFDEITNGKLEAGKPYLFEVTNPSLISFYKQVNAAHSDDEIETNGMIGTFSGTTLYQGAENYYYFSGRHIWKVNDFTVAIPIPANRCYVDYDVLLAAPAPLAPAPGRRRVTLGINGNNAPTDVENVQSDEVQCTKVMINGQLFILRGEKMFDATGRLVK